MARYVLALDAGGGSGRALAVDLEGRRFATAQETWGYQVPEDARPMGAEFDPERFWDALCRTARAALHQVGAAPEDVAAVSATTMREACVLVDREGREVYAGPNRDARALQQGLEQAAKHGQQAYEITGHWPNPIFAAARIPWLRRHRPETLERAWRLLMINDWILYRLSGRDASEPSNAAETCLFDIHRLTWSLELAERFGVPADLFAPLLRPGQVLGAVTGAAARAVGVTPGTPVVVGGADTQCGVLGSGALRPGDVCAVAGTTAPVQILVDRPVLDPQARTWTCPYLLDGLWAVESNAGATGISLQWFKDNFYPAPGGAGPADGAAPDPFEQVLSAAERSPVGANGVLAYMGPQVMNARSFPMHPGGFVVGQPFTLMGSGEVRNDFARAVLEAMAFAIKANLDQVVEVSGLQPDRLLACGGSTKSRLWLQMLADVTGLDVVAPAIREATALGAALCAAVGAGAYPDLPTAARAMVHHDPAVVPQAANRPKYRRAFERWQATREMLLRAGSSGFGGAG